MQPLLVSIFLLAFVAIGLALYLRWGMQWNSTATERSAEMPGDAFLEASSATRVVMTRAISISAPANIVWPWLAQLGRGAGWYSFDRLDNGGKVSAEHIVSWIPEPRLGDATAIGCLRHIEPRRALAWWVKGVRFAGAEACLVTDMRLDPVGERSRLVVRMSADASGPTAPIALLVFRFIDSIMARRQLLGVKRRVERYGARSADLDVPESGAKDQYQLYEVIYASGERAGLQGKESAAQ